MNFRRTVLIALASLVAVSAFAQLSPEFRDWPKSPAGYLLTEEEQTRWKNVKSDADARSFEELFWARRDPTPGTPVNEFRQEFDSRVEFADRQFSEGRKKGSLTDRGKLYIMLGPPTRPIQRSGAATGVSTPGSTDNAARQIWTYEQSKLTLPLGTVEAQFSFTDQFGTNQWSYDRGGRVDVNGLYRAAAQASISQPNLTVAPGAQPAPAQTVQLPTAPPPAASPFDAGVVRTESLRTAVTEFKTAKTNPYKSATVTYTELLSPAGDYFVPVQLYIPKSAGLTAESVTTFFGVVEDATGKTVAEFEEPAKLSASKGDLYFDRSMKLTPGTYRATLGLAGAGGMPVVMAAAPMELKELSKDATGLSRLVVSKDVHETAEAAVIGAPFAFGRVKIVPKGDRVFTNRDEITYFVEIVNPAIDEATNLPKLQVKLDLVQAGTAGKPGRTISAPISDASALPLNGQPGQGQYAILAGIPLSQMKNPLPAGDYTLRVKVFDQVKKENWTVEQKLTLVNAPATTASQ